MPKGDGERFVMTIDACYTIIGRGTVVAGEVQHGIVKVGDVVKVVHAGTIDLAQCNGVEMIRVHPLEGDYMTVPDSSRVCRD